MSQSFENLFYKQQLIPDSLVDGGDGVQCVGGATIEQDSFSDSYDKSSLCSPLGTFVNLEYIFETYPVVKRIFDKISRCGIIYPEFLNIKTLDTINIKAFCDNRVCKNPECQKHRLLKFMKEHMYQIFDIQKDMRKPKAWIFTVPHKKYPIDRKYCMNKLKFLFYLLSKDKHSSFGSSSLFSVHMEIKSSVNSWFLHFHIVSGGITNLRFIKKKWKYMIRYQVAISPKQLSRYVSKYASKTPFFPNKLAFFEYAQAVYKLQMHRFSTKIKKSKIVSDWVLIGISGYSKSNDLFSDMSQYLDRYVDDFGYGS